MSRLNRILLVDDDKVFNFLTRATLKENGVHCRIDEALDGQDALDYIAAQQECPDVILLDINMPRVDGFEFLKEFEKHAARCVNTKIFMLTSSEREEDRTNANNNKYVTGYFDKPLSDSNIQEIVAMFT